MNKNIDLPGYKPEAHHWNRWEKAAKERGIERTLAELGREVIRDADQHSWSEPVKQLCNGRNLLEMMTRAPFLSRRLCEILIETDGLRVAYPEEGNQNDVIRLPGFGGLH